MENKGKAILGIGLIAGLAYALTRMTNLQYMKNLMWVTEGRRADDYPGQAEYWAQQIDEGKMTRLFAAAQFAGSAETRARGVSLSAEEAMAAAQSMK